jgi:hypothetical protein
VGSIRNQQMIDKASPDIVVAFPGGVGTRDLVERAIEAKVEVWQPKPEDLAQLEPCRGSDFYCAEKRRPRKSEFPDPR